MTDVRVKATLPDGTPIASWTTKENGTHVPDRPKIVCLCGSTRFYREFQEANYRLTMQGIIVLTVGFYVHAATDAIWQERKHGEDIGVTEQEKQMLDELHKRKIDLADEILVLNVGGYIGSSTRSEIEYANEHGKPVKYLDNGALQY